MESGAALFILIAALLVIGVPVLAIVAYVRVGAVKRGVEAEAAQLIRRIYALEQRLTQIEKGLSALPAPAAAIPQRETGESPAAVAHPPMPAAPPASAPSQPERPSVAPAPPASPAHPPAPVPQHAPALSSPISSAAAVRHDDEGNFEAVVAGRWLNYVGILALLFAVTFFLKYAFDNNWV